MDGVGDADDGGVGEQLLEDLGLAVDELGDLFETEVQEAVVHSEEVAGREEE